MPGCPPNHSFLFLFYFGMHYRRGREGRIEYTEGLSGRARFNASGRLKGVLEK